MQRRRLKVRPSPLRPLQLRPARWLLLTALLYFAATTIATRDATAQGWQIPQRQQTPPTQLQGPTATPAEQTQEVQDPTVESPEAGGAAADSLNTQGTVTDTLPIETRTIYRHEHIAVILPLQASAYGRLAQQVKLGIEMAANMASYDALPITVYSTTADSRRILEAYDKAVNSGARAVIGPLTRDGVSALADAGSVAIPTIALNVPDANISLPQQMYVFGLQIETEAAQVAKLAFANGGRKALVVVGETALGQRIARAFEQKWKSLKGDVADEFIYSTDAHALTNLRHLVNNTAADMVFLAVNAPRARFIRAYLGSQFPVYATSLVYASNADKLELYDLDGVRFMDMPWLLQQDHPAVMTYFRTQMASTALDEERFYALGIDAYRIALALLRGASSTLQIDGVTGAIRLERNNHFTHELTPAYFAYGKARLLNEDANAEQ